MGGYLSTQVLMNLLLWVEGGIDVYIPHRKYQGKPHPSSRFSTACGAAIVHRNNLLCL